MAVETNSEFLNLVRKSGIVDEDRLSVALKELRAAGELAEDPSMFATQLVTKGLVTRFQADQILEGRWRRFFIGKYKVLERIGSGGMGAVFLCEHRLMRRRVAVKVLPTALAEQPSILERFYREAQAVAALDHPNIVRAYDIDHDNELHFLVMEYVDGTSLQQLVERGGPLTPVRAAHYISQVAQGMQYAHEKAMLIHRDIKPANIVVDRAGTVKILDLGLARFFGEEDSIAQKYNERILGTADYLAPEQVLDSYTVDIRADLYSLGATFYFLLTAQPPFPSGTVSQKLIWHQTRQPKSVRAFRSDVPEEMERILAKMLAKDPDRRFLKPQDVVDALAPWTKEPLQPPGEAEMPSLGPVVRMDPPRPSGGPSTPKIVLRSSDGEGGAQTAGRNPGDRGAAQAVADSLEILPQGSYTATPVPGNSVTQPVPAPLVRGEPKTATQPPGSPWEEIALDSSESKKREAVHEHRVSLLILCALVALVLASIFGVAMYVSLNVVY